MLRNTLLTLTAGVLSLSAAYAQSTSTVVTPPTNTVSANADLTAVQPEKKSFPLSVSTDSYFYGPQVQDPFSDATTADTAGDPKQGLLTRHVIGFKYKLSKKVSITPNIDFFYQLTDPAKTASQSSAGQFRWRDCYVKVGHSSIFETDLNTSHFSLPVDFRYYAPTSKGSRDSSSAGSVRASLNPSLQFGHSDFSLSTVNYVRYWIQTQESYKGRPLIQSELYTGPQLNYQMGSIATAFVLYEAAIQFNTLGQSTPGIDPNASLTDLEPGVELHLNDRITVTPYLNWFLNQPVSSTTINLNANFRLL